MGRNGIRIHKWPLTYTFRYFSRIAACWTSFGSWFGAGESWEGVRITWDPAMSHTFGSKACQHWNSQDSSLVGLETVWIPSQNHSRLNQVKEPKSKLISLFISVAFCKNSSTNSCHTIALTWSPKASTSRSRWQSRTTFAEYHGKAMLWRTTNNYLPYILSLTKGK